MFIHVASNLQQKSINNSNQWISGLLHNYVTINWPWSLIDQYQSNYTNHIIAIDCFIDFSTLILIDLAGYNYTGEYRVLHVAIGLAFCFILLHSLNSEYSSNMNCFTLIVANKCVQTFIYTKMYIVQFLWYSPV
jgi:hypothetical protein